MAYVSKEKQRVWDWSETMNLWGLFHDQTPEQALANVRDYLQPHADRAAKKDLEVRLHVEEYDGSEWVAEVEVKTYRWETDREYKSRVAKEDAAKEKKRLAAEKRKASALKRALETEAEERALFEQLKAKFGE